ncbi:hypothetical protein I7I50_05272 [Histoplasma capsulatum G186AR]|uniref:Uncharacterized protein n=1 Tax=Ajellomyces capsulatus TaxID=5037 RepID=A0A8H7Z6I9_AJECA|nr:hypothetical protein I7I52_03531 [Histoplasma capsulatum]QSS75964.1 hypothetical protein I7I50_05272 [Histoplasma capsulatum G186AR]
MDNQLCSTLLLLFFLTFLFFKLFDLWFHSSLDSQPPLKQPKPFFLWNGWRYLGVYVLYIYICFVEMHPVVQVGE